MFGYFNTCKLTLCTFVSFLQNTTMEYSLESLCASVCVCVFVCVFLHDN